MMRHPYATNSSERRVVPFLIAAVAIVTAVWILPWIYQKAGWTPPVWIDAPGTLSLYGFFYLVFDRWLWRIGMFHRFGLQIPNLSGRWHGTVTTDHDGTTHDVTVDIGQDWTRILVDFRTAHSRSHSLTAAITTSEDATFLTYEYLNEPMPGAVRTMHAHRGSARVEVQDGGNKLVGDYYSGRDRKNVGRIALER